MKNILLIIASTIISLIATFNILLSNGSIISESIFQFGVLLWITAFLKPRTALFLLICISPYLDLFKRILWIEQSISTEAIIKILLIPSLTVTILFIESLISTTTSKNDKFRKEYFRYFSIAMGLCFVNSILILKSQGGINLSALKEIANSAIYPTLIPVVYRLFPTREQFAKSISFVPLLIIPTIIYSLVQAKYGYADFELGYLLEGWSIESRQLGLAYPRPFSTYANPTAMGLIFVFGIGIYIYTQRAKKSKNTLFAFLYIALANLGIFFSATRKTWVAVIVFFIVDWALQHRKRVYGVYAAGLMTVLGVFASTEFLLNNLNDFDKKYLTFNDPVKTQFLNIGTLENRILGFHNFVYNPVMRPFIRFSPPDNPGTSKQAGRLSNKLGPVYSHDLLTRTIFAYGLLPVGIMLIGGGIILVKTTNRALRINDDTTRCIIALAISMFSVMLSGKSITLYPVNLFFWLMIAATCLKKTNTKSIQT